MHPDINQCIALEQAWIQELQFSKPYLQILLKIKWWIGKKNIQTTELKFENIKL